MRLLAVVSLVAASLVPLAAQEVYKPGNGVSTPVAIRSVKPGYTEDAKKAHIQGVATVYAVVNTDGSVSDVRIARSLDATFGLDEQAVKAAKEWKFKPGVKDGKPVAVQVMIEMRFTLK
jgi:TonB family protein